MRIRTQEDVDKLEEQIKNELDIDVGKYRNEEVVENFVELIVFPEYVITWVIRPVLFSLILFIIGFFVLDLVHIEYLIYGIFGIGLFLISGLLAGLILLLARMRSDMWGIIDYSIDIMKLSIRDLKKANLNVNEDNRKSIFGLLFKGVIHIVTIPLLSKVISQKVPFVGGIINRLVKKVLILVSDRIKFDEKNLEKELRREEGSQNALQIYSENISSDSTGLEKILNVTFGIAKFPLIIGFVCSFIVLSLFIYLIH